MRPVVLAQRRSPQRHLGLPLTLADRRVCWIWRARARTASTAKLATFFRLVFQHGPFYELDCCRPLQETSLQAFVPAERKSFMLLPPTTCDVCMHLFRSTLCGATSSCRRHKFRLLSRHRYTMGSSRAWPPLRIGWAGHGCCIQLENQLETRVVSARDGIRSRLFVTAVNQISPTTTLHHGRNDALPNFAPPT